MSYDRLAAGAERYYTGKFHEHGATARGVDWNSEASQELRFEQLLQVVRPRAGTFSIVDYGCGYGALADHLARNRYVAEYTGFDLSEPMIEHARAHHPNTTRWTTVDSALIPADYAVASGLMNVRQEIPEPEWFAYCMQLIARLSALSTRGFAFNMLTAYSDPERKRRDLYYGDPRVFFDECKRSYSRHVALLHDYGLYEFTLIVRKEIS
jgi:SAM-dependent methyltransferase